MIIVKFINNNKLEMNYKKAHPDFGNYSSSFSTVLTIYIEQRKSEAERIRERYPDRIPVICEKSETSKLPDIDKTK
jgi:hypothetical protein